MKSGYSLPKIRIYSAIYLLGPASKQLFKLNIKKGLKYPSPDEFLRTVKNYKKAWAKHEGRLLKGICDVLKLRFFQNTIDVHVVPYWPTSISNPMIIHSYYDPDRFVDILTHELLHRLLTDNTSKLDVKKIWGKMFPDKKQITRNHILVHAVHKYLFLEILKSKSRLERDIEWSQKFPAYKESWDFVEKKGYKEIIREFRTYY